MLSESIRASKTTSRSYSHIPGRDTVPPTEGDKGASPALEDLTPALFHLSPPKGAMRPQDQGDMPTCHPQPLPASRPSSRHLRSSNFTAPLAPQPTSRASIGPSPIPPLEGKHDTDVTYLSLKGSKRQIFGGWAWMYWPEYVQSPAVCMRGGGDKGTLARGFHLWSCPSPKNVKCLCGSKCT